MARERGDVMFLFYYNPCNCTTASIEADLEQERLEWREKERQDFAKAFPSLLSRIVQEAKKKLDTTATEREISSLLSRAERQGTLPKNAFKASGDLFAKAFFAFRGKLAEKLARPLLECFDGKERQRLAIKILDHPFLDSMERLEQRADLLRWQLVEAGCCTMSTRRLQILSIPKSIRNKIGEAAKNPKAAEDAIVSLCLPSLEKIMERKRMAEKRDRLVKEIKDLIRNSPDPPSDRLVRDILSSDIESMSLTSIESALYDRFGFRQVQGVVESIARARWPSLEEPTRDGFWKEKREIPEKQSIREMEGVLKRVLASRKAGDGNRDSSQKMRRSAR